MIRNIIWDFDGTLFDTYTAQSHLISKIMSREYAVTMPVSSIRRLTAISLGYAFQELARIARADEDGIRNHFVRSYALVTPEEEFPFAHAVDICSAVSLSGGKNMINTHRGRERLILLLKHYDMQDLFTDFITADDDFPRKPDPASFYALLERNRIPAKETLVIGDRELDILGGKNARIPTFFFNSNSIDAARIESDYSGDTLKGVFPLISRRRGKDGRNLFRSKTVPGQA